jgi:hypothetical protein
MAPQELPLLGTWPTERKPTVDTMESSAPAHPISDQKPTKPDDLLEAHYSCLERLEESLAHELLPDEERCELRDRVLALRRRISL